jgi:hypothetical protein
LHLQSTLVPTRRHSAVSAAVVASPSHCSGSGPLLRTSRPNSPTRTIGQKRKASSFTARPIGQCCRRGLGRSSSGRLYLLGVPTRAWTPRALAGPARALPSRRRRAAPGCPEALAGAGDRLPTPTGSAATSPPISRCAGHFWRSDLTASRLASKGTRTRAARRGSVIAAASISQNHIMMRLVAREDRL